MSFDNYSKTPSANTSIAGQSIAPGGPPSSVGPAIRQLMADGKELSENQVVIATKFLVSPTATAAQNLSRFKAAVAALSDGDILDVPPGLYLVDTSGGLSTAIEINKRVTIRLRGDIQATFSAIQANPPYIFNLTAAGAAIIGPGRIIGDGLVNDLNDSSAIAEQVPGLIRIAADNCTLEDIEFVTAPKVAVLIYQANRARIVGCKLTGGVTLYRGDLGTAYFGIYAAGGGGHVIDGCRFYPDASNGMFVQCVFLNGSDDNLIVNCLARYPYEKLVYGFGNRNSARSNNIMGNPGFVPGTNIKGTITAVIRFHGNDNIADGNYAYGCAGGVQFMGRPGVAGSGTGNSAVNNKFISCGQGGISVFDGLHSRTKLSNNICTYGALSGFTTGDGIRIATKQSVGQSKYIDVRGNTVTAFSVSDPIANVATWAPGTYPKVAIVKPSVGNGRYYTYQGAGGASGASEPTWPTTIGTTVTDGALVWTCVAYEGNQSEIRAIGYGTGDEITESQFQENNTSGGVLGIRLEYTLDSKISGNKLNASTNTLVEVSGARNRYELNDQLGAGAIGVSGMASTSIIFDSKKISWSPNPGSGLTIGGVLTSTGWYIRHGDQVTVWGEFRDTVGVSNSSGGLVCDNLPVAAVKSGAGSLVNTDGASPSGCFVVPAPDAAGKPTGSGPNKLYAGSTGTRSTLIFTLTYPIA